MKRQSAQRGQSQSEIGDFDRRRHSRHDGAGLVIEIGGQSLPVVDISTGGLSLRDFDRPLGAQFRLVLSRAGAAAAGIATECEVVSKDGRLTRLTFTRPTLPLLRLVVTHVSTITGIVPHVLTSG
ncbi:hypothetical protein [Magnetospirillum sulfuroxidans]|uniref:PilZ domain-containing protein n=1 Tax=Magnetospirillum sulfuroxidans TaxID=611300 RepID=A0ABS5IB92_9PROT|nr:hypothetical protein [Magnetospirillum sulfuroxidans]MBR9971536.1 hypothetical protein [Magnetospirillum sulfuroxidans]